MQLDDEICYCFHITKRKIFNFIRIHKPRRASQVSECGGAGTGCGWCVPYLTKIHEDVLAGREPEPAMSREEYLARRAAYRLRVTSGDPNPRGS